MLFSTPKHKDLIYDVGMFDGHDTAFYLKKGFRVIAFEAMPKFIEKNKKKFEKEIEEGKLIIVEGAITDKTDVENITFYVSEKLANSTAHEWLAQIHKKHFNSDTEAITVPAVDFSAALKKYGVPYYMKIDIEGSDMLCIEALKNFKERPDYLTVEMPTGHYEGCHNFIQQLSEIGYKYYQLVAQIHKNHKQKEPNPSREGNYIGENLNWPLLFGKDIPKNKWKNKRRVKISFYIAVKMYEIFWENKTLEKNLSLLGKPGKKLFQMMRTRATGKMQPWNDMQAKHESAD